MSLSPRGFFWLMGFIISVSLMVGLYFWSLGAWPVFGFFGLEVFLIYGAFRLNYRHGRRFEMLEMSDNQLVFSQISPLGKKRDWRFDPYWVRVKLERFDDEDEIGNLILTSHGKYVSVGAFLAPDERASLAASLQLCLADLRRRPIDTEPTAPAAA